MQEINWEMYRNNQIYHDLVDHMIENEQKAGRLQQQDIAAQSPLRVEQAQLDAEAAYRRRRMLGYVNQIPYQQLTLVRPMQWRGPYSVYQDNFVNYWSHPTQPDGQFITPAQNREYLRSVFHSAVDCAAQLSKEKSPVTSIIFDGLGVLTAGNLFEAAKSVASLIDTANGFPKDKI